MDHHHHGADGHQHAHHAGDHGRAFLIGIVLNILFVGVEWTFGLMAHSLALMADAVHNLGDVLALILAWSASVLARRLPTERFTYGWRGFSTLAALANAVMLLLVTGGLAWEAIQRFASPQPVQGAMVMAVAAFGILINSATAWLFMSGSQTDLNIRGAYLHMLSDAAVSLGVVVAGAIVLMTGWVWLDPLITLAVAVVITWATGRLLLDSFKLAVQAVPENIDTSEVRAFLKSLPGVSEVHDLHIWAMSTTEYALTAHLVCPPGHPGDSFLQKISRDIEQKFGIHHVTIQIEVADSSTPCALAPEHVV